MSFSPARQPAAAVLALVLGAATLAGLAVPALAEPAPLEGDPRDPFFLMRRQMVREQIEPRGIDNPRLIAALERVPRHEFVPAEYRAQAHGPEPLPIGWGQSIYQPYMVALMTELLELEGEEKVLEIGTGSGYHSAVLACMAKEVFTIEINEKLARRARRTLAAHNYFNVETRIGDGYLGWPEEAPFDAIILTAAPPELPQPLLDQLKVGGRMVVPIGSQLQDLMLITKTEDGITKRRIQLVRLPAMTGEVEKQN